MGRKVILIDRLLDGGDNGWSCPSILALAVEGNLRLAMRWSVAGCTDRQNGLGRPSRETRLLAESPSSPPRRNVNDQNLVYSSYCPCFVLARSGCEWSSTGSGDYARHCLLRARRAGADGRYDCDPSWSDRGGGDASADPQAYRDDFLPRLHCARRFLECACAFHGAEVERCRESARG